MNNFWKKPWLVRLSSLLLAILIVVYIDTTHEGFIPQGQLSRTRQTASEVETIKVPLQVSVNTDKYYVVGYPEKVKVTLEGPNALVTSTVNTQNFRVYIDLTHYGIGKHTVKVKTTGLSKQLAYRINPKIVKVDIERRKSRTMPVQIGYNKSAVAAGYHVGKLAVNPAQVEVTGARAEVDQIDQIVAKVVLPNGTNHSYDRQVILIAEDNRGQQLNVVIQPTTARVTIPISIAKKTVKLNLNSKNEDSAKVYSVTAKQNEVILYGEQKVLDKLRRLNVDVDLKGIMSSSVRTYPIKLPRGVIKADPSVVQIQIKVKNAGSTKAN